MTAMPIFDGLDIPAVEWCSIPQAILWIEARDVPLTEFHESVLPDLSQPVPERQKESGRKRLILQAASGGVKFRGRPSRGKVEIVFDQDQKPSHAKSEQWGEVETIRPDKIELAGLAGLQAEGGELIGCEPSSPTPWAYAEVEVNFKQLMALYPAPAGEKVRVGGDAKPVGRTDPAPDGDTPPPLALPPPHATA
jgi:hypothetical protein